MRQKIIENLLILAGFLLSLGMLLQGINVI